MKRLHLSINVNNLDASVRFYTDLFGEAPEEHHSDLAKWRLDDPPVNFALSAGGDAGVNHVGIQAETSSELEELRNRIAQTEAPKKEEGQVTCCYAKSDKTWIVDPQNIPWEIFQTHGASETFGMSGALDDLIPGSAEEGKSCCSTSATAPEAEECCTPAADAKETGCC